jgi:hypothetical protein
MHCKLINAAFQRRDDVAATDGYNRQGHGMSGGIEDEARAATLKFLPSAPLLGGSWIHD